MVGTGSVWDGGMNRIVIGRTPDAENLTPAQTVEMKDRLMPSLPLTSMAQILCKASRRDACLIRTLCPASYRPSVVRASSPHPARLRTRPRLFIDFRSLCASWYWRLMMFEVKANGSQDGKLSLISLQW